VVFWLYDAVSSGGETDPGKETPEYGEDVAAGYDAEEDGEYVECPHCAKVVPADQVRECEVCEVQGCSNCIRVMGLLKKKMTCRECFDSK
jgi:hypothetical protein